MRLSKSIQLTACFVLICSWLSSVSRAGEYEIAFSKFLQPLVRQRCVKCHGGKAVNGKVDFAKVKSAQHLLQQPRLIKEMLEAIDARDMPPESEPALNKQTRSRLLAVLKLALRQATAKTGRIRPHMHRLNRFQYNNTVKDLFQLKSDVFKLPEKLMTRNSNYLRSATQQMPQHVNVTSHALNPRGGMRGVRAFPKDLRASHGFDNQSDQLTLSPLLLDSFMRLSISIVESPDFNEKNVGIWPKLFADPGNKTQNIIRQRLRDFLYRGFRRPVQESTVQRYVAYVQAKMKQGLSYTAAMKKVASAVLSSPLFLYRASTTSKKETQYEFASRLSYFLWSSCPDDEVLRLAKSGDLTRPAVLERTINRMFADPKIERFLDAFPTQWMQLENILAATPDPAKNRYFSLDRRRPAGLQMVLEPLLLFDAIFIENRPIEQFIAPKFGYQSEFLKTWYNSQLKPPPIDETAIRKANQRHQRQKNDYRTRLKRNQLDLNALTQPVKMKILAARNKGKTRKPVDLKPYAAWEFDGNLKDSIGKLHLRAHGKVVFQGGMVQLNRSFLLSQRLPINLAAKTLEVWCKVPNLDQRGGGVMGIQGPGDFFDTIVIGERKPRHWISGSNRFARTKDFPGSTRETKVNQMLHLVMVYDANGTTRLYRDGEPYGRSYHKGRAVFPRNRSSVIFGLRHLPAGGNRFLTVTIDKARLYNRALTAEEVKEANLGKHLYVSQSDLLNAFTSKQKTKWESLRKQRQQLQADLRKVPPHQDIGRLRANSQRRYDSEILAKMRDTKFERLAMTDPRYGGVITNAAMLSMTSGPTRTHPIARGAWIIEVIFNDPPPPPPNDVPPLNEEASSKKLTIREKFAVHRSNPSCAGCHSRLDPLGFALENFDITGRWRDKYSNGRRVDASGILMRKHRFPGVVRFKQALVQEKRRFAKSFTAHMLRFAAARELVAADTLEIDAIVTKAAGDDYKLRSIIREVIRSDAFFKRRKPNAD